jgi:hypothetical protein
MPRKRRSPGDLSQRQYAAINALLTERSVEAAATKSGCCLRSLNVWMGDPDFLRRYRAEQGKITAGVVGRVVGAYSVAVETLIEICTDTKQKASDRIRAAAEIVYLNAHVNELNNLKERIDELAAVRGTIWGNNETPVTNPPASEPLACDPATRTSEPGQTIDGAAIDVATVPSPSESAGSEAGSADDAGDRDAGDGERESPDDNNELNFFTDEE